MMREPALQRSTGRGLRAVLSIRAVQLWLLFMLACAFVVHRAQFTTDLSAFLPRAPTAEQRLLVDQLRDGVVSRLMLVAIEGGDAPGRAALSKRLATALRQDPQFASVDNGEPVTEERDQRFVFDHRYVLSPLVTPERFSVQGLHQAFGDSFDLLSSSAGLMVKTLLPRDPTGEANAFVSRLDSGEQPSTINGVWASRDGTRAMLVMQTVGAGSDIDAQDRAIIAVHSAFDTASRRENHNASPYRLVLSGPGVFSVEMRETIKHDVEALSSVSLALIVGLLLVIYRSPLTLALGLLPVLSGVAAGLAAVILAFGRVHGLTLGFGTTLMGEAVDYSIYLFVQSAGSAAGVSAAPAAKSMREWVAAYWPTIRLGVLTSVCGFASMLFSGFPGLVQLGLYSIAGLAVAAIVTRYVLPNLRSRAGTIRDVSKLADLLVRGLRAAPRLRWPLVALLAASVTVLALHRDQLWSRELSALSPVPAHSKELDTTLRADVGAPDVRYLVVVSGDNEQTVLEGAEKIGTQLQPLVDKGVIGGYESPARYLPSDVTQRARLASLPPADVLTERINHAVERQSVHIKPEVFEPFVADVEAARRQPLIKRTDLQGTSMALAVDALLSERAGRWSAMLSMRAPASDGARGLDAARESSLDADAIRAAVDRAGLPNALFVDMKTEADRVYVNYLREDIRLSLAGFAAIIVLLLIAQRRPQRVAGTLLPLIAAVLVVTAGFALAHEPLTILHLIGLLLIVAVGSNYALFFNRGTEGHDPAHACAPFTPFINGQTLVSLVIANLATVAGFGLLALSHVPMLRSFGLTVGPGAVLALLFSAILAPQRSRMSSLECHGNYSQRPK
jgi:predicted exporter